MFRAARALGLPVKLHAEQLSNLGGAVMAAGYGALSVDHIEYLDEADVVAIAGSGTVAVLLPGAFYYCARSSIRRSRSCARTRRRSRSRPTSIRAHRRFIRCSAS